MYAEIFDNNKRYKIISVTSHLSLGEAFGNCMKKSEEATDAFLDLIKSIQPNLEIIGNDEIDKIFSEIRMIFTRLSITDSIHLATAIRNKCENLRTVDKDLYELENKKVFNVAQKYGCKDFKITNMEEKIKKWQK